MDLERVSLLMKTEQKSYTGQWAIWGVTVWSRDMSLSPHPRAATLGGPLLSSEAIPGQTCECDSACSYLKLEPLQKST